MNSDESPNLEPTVETNGESSGTESIEPSATEPNPSKPNVPEPTVAEMTVAEVKSASAFGAGASLGLGSGSTGGGAGGGAGAIALPSLSSLSDPSGGDARLASLRNEEQQLKQEIAALRSTLNTLQRQLTEAQADVGRLVKEGLSELEQRKQTLQIAVDQLERRQERIKNEMRTSFAGASQDMAIRVQGFKDYLVGSLQDLASAAEQLQLAPKLQEQKRPPAGEPSRDRDRDRGDRDRDRDRGDRDRDFDEGASAPRFAAQGFQDEAKQIRKLLDQYRSSPDYYGPPWQLRRTFEPVHAERISGWFFTQGGRGAIRTMGSRLQNILVASSAISVLRRLHGDRLRTLVLADSPERLGEWRRGLQDCLGVSRADFGANEGLVLFETPEPLAQRADRLVKQKLLPLIIIDESEDDRISLSLLQFPLWLAIAGDPMNPTLY